MVNIFRFVTFVKEDIYTKLTLIDVEYVDHIIVLISYPETAGQAQELLCSIWNFLNILPNFSFQVYSVSMNSFEGSALKIAFMSEVRAYL